MEESAKKSCSALESYDFSGSKYGNQERRKAVVAYLVHGTYVKASKATRISESTIRLWTKTDWWEGVRAQVCDETNAEIRANYTEIIQEGNRVALEGLRGDDVKPKDAIIMSAVAFDKRQLLDNMPTRITQTDSRDSLQAKLEALAQRTHELERVEKAKVVSEQSGEDSGD